MELKTVAYNYSEINNNQKIKKKFKEDISVSHIIYLFYNGNECLYIGESCASLKDRCYTNTPKHTEKEWFKLSNKIHIIKLDECIDNIARQTLESTFILAYRPKYNKKA
ncbi:hypothetical protein [Savagea faecisuis]|uniref:GIY-YIG domain-containing protein n=1 Tax=Savagea faecisuis TaxID=1274803 RepID=A0ABW3GV24_9BACL